MSHSEDASASTSWGAELHVGLVHHPVYDRQRKIVATNITNFDVHDIARVCRCYGVKSYTLIHPSEEQLMFVSRIRDHWVTGYGKKFNPLRSEALDYIYTAKSVKEAVVKHGITQAYATSARQHEAYPQITFSELKNRVKEQAGEQILLLFGTGFGLSQEVFEQCHGLLEPIAGSHRTDFRHLSVRSAVGIALDRLVGS